MVRKQGAKSQVETEMQAVSEAFVTEAVQRISKKVSPYEARAAADELYQTFLATMPFMSGRVHFIHRSKTPGYRRDQQRAFAFNMAHLANQVARQEALPTLEGTLRSAEG
jgi:hypothetical protein